QAAEVDVDPATVPAAVPVPAGADPFDPDLFERMARQAQVERNRKSPSIAPPAASPVPDLPVAPPVVTPAKERTVTTRQITCLVCGHGFPSNRPDDVPQVCPQCQTTFNVAKGHVVSGGAKPTNGDPLLGRALRGCLIDRKVGEGGMGSVYHARQLSLDRSVAVKVLPPELARNRNFISRFEREAKSLARINHPNILHIYDFGEDQQLGIYFMIIEFVEGRDLGDLLHETYTLGQIEVLDIVRQAAMGLEQAAEKGVIHRDIKPDNLMLTKEGICKVSDFGLAKANTAEKNITTIGVRVGTPAFISPEQCDGDDVDFRSDVYNLGCTAFIALTGQLPYDADTPFAIMLKHKNDPVPSPRSFNPNLDARVERLVMRMIAKRPADRFDTLRELVEIVEDLEVKLAGTSTVLRKTRGPFRAMTDLEAVEHARMTSSGIRASPLGNEPAASPSSPVPKARPVTTPAPVGPSVVPDWLKPVEDSKPRKTTSNLQPMPTPRPTPQAGTTSQREMKDLRSKLTEARQRNMQDEAHTLASEGDRLAANGQMAQAADAWTRAATMTPNAAEATSLLMRASKARRGRGFGKFFKGVLILAALLAGLGVGAFYGVPVGHNFIAERQVEPLRAIAVPQARLT
ncbi:MAG TPA: protein kinase, partial [Planctomycetota bacterium]|nr:protein kinase [Planctomycetota bacterium]